MKVLDGQKKELMTVKEISRDGDALIIKGKLFGTMPVTARLTPEEARKAFKLMAPGMLWFLATFLFRRTPEV
jgi:hypothetical protein